MLFFLEKEFNIHVIEWEIEQFISIRVKERIKW